MQNTQIQFPGVASSSLLQLLCGFSTPCQPGSPLLLGYTQGQLPRWHALDLRIQSTIYQPASEYALHVAHNAFHQLTLFLFLTSLPSFLFLTSFPTITTSVLFHPIYANIHTCIWCFHISLGVPFFFLIWKLPYLLFRLLIQLLLPYEDFNPLIIRVSHIVT